MEEILAPDMREGLRESFSLLRQPVKLVLFSGGGTNDQYNQVIGKLLEEMAAIDTRLSVESHTIGDGASKKYGVERSPTLLIAPEQYSIRFTGSPLGEQGRSLIVAIIMASTGKTVLSPESLKRLERLKEKRHVRVFVSPTCPYCPQEAMSAISAAIAKPDLVSTEIIEIYENLDLAEQHSAMSVPKTFVDDVNTSQGLEPEEFFVESVVLGKRPEFLAPLDREHLRDYDVVVVGAGPAGLTASIYAERSGMKSLILEKANVGGQVAITPVIENYTGFPSIAGKTLVDLMARQATEYALLLQGIGVDDISKKNERFEIITKAGTYTARAVIIATGATYKKLGVPGEERLSGLGVSYCATCDGYIYKDGKSVSIVGGGNTALTDALYLDSLGARVTLIHRREAFRAEERLQQAVSQRNIEIISNSRVVDIQGRNKVEQIVVEHTGTEEKTTMPTDGIFISIGYKPNNELAGKIGLELDDEGYVKTDDRLRTSVPGIYAAGDITGTTKQISVAVGQGSIAAITIFEDITRKMVREPLK